MWVLMGLCAYRCRVDDMREKERRRQGEVPPTYSRSNLESGRDECQPLLGAVSARAGGLIQVQDDGGAIGAGAVAVGGSFGTDSDE